MNKSKDAGLQSGSVATVNFRGRSCNRPRRGAKAAPARPGFRKIFQTRPRPRTPRPCCTVPNSLNQKTIKISTNSHSRDVVRHLCRVSYNLLIISDTSRRQMSLVIVYDRVTRDKTSRLGQWRQGSGDRRSMGRGAGLEVKRNEIIDSIMSEKFTKTSIRRDGFSGRLSKWRLC